MLRKFLLGGALAAIALSSASAETIRWAAAGDSLTLDPHAQNEGPTHTLSHQIYEPLLHRDMAGKIVPALATEWSPTENPDIWEFKLRQGVKFHDGASMTAEDVVFSLNRARHPDSAMRDLLASVIDVIAVDEYTVHIVTDGPNPILPSNLTNLFIMDKGWSETNNVVKPQDYKSGEENYAVRNANGTGAYRLASREPDARTVLVANEDYWGIGEFPLGASELIFTPIQNAATRVAALLSGEVDFIQDVPVQDLERVAATEGLDVRTAPQNRVIFFGMNVGDADLESDDVEGRNPFASVEVRKAMNLAIDREAIRQVVMRGQSIPAGMIAPPFVHGWTEELDSLPEGGVERARELMAEAGFADGFSVRLDCPNDRYVNDEGICQAVVGMLAQIGIKVNLDAKTKALHFPLIENLETDFFLLGWGVPTFDSEYIFSFLVHSRDDTHGSFNGTRYSNPELDARIESLASETDLDLRDATIAEIWETVQEETIYLPVHHQVLNWGIRSDLRFDVQPEDQPHFKYLQID